MRVLFRLDKILILMVQGRSLSRYQVRRYPQSLSRTVNRSKEPSWNVDPSDPENLYHSACTGGDERNIDG